jgi:protein-arginine kinase activator protein McsA
MLCKQCSEEVEETVLVEVGRKKVRVCEQCADIMRENAEIAEDAEGAMGSMMEYKGRR